MATVSTSTLRSWWAPHCSPPMVAVPLNGDGLVSVRPSITGAVQALDRCLVAARYRTRRADTGAYNCRRITNGSNYSLHAYGIALDINWQTNPYGTALRTDMPTAMLNAVKGIRTRNGKQVWRWGGDYSGNKDAMHFEITCAPADIASGLNNATTPGAPGIAERPVRPAVPIDGVRRGSRDKPGDRAGPVHWLQDMLNMVRHKQKKPLLAADGIYGPGTVAAVRDFQTFVNAMADLAKSTAPRWTVSGTAGPKTIGGLRWWVDALYT